MIFGQPATVARVGPPPPSRSARCRSAVRQSGEPVNVMTVGLLAIALYGVVVIAWLRHDKDPEHPTSEEGRS